MGDRFREAYYGGPFVRVEHPDRGLPRRDPGVPISDEMRRQVEREGMFEGERLVAPFNDANTIEQIVVEISEAQGYPDSWDDEQRFYFPTIQGCLAEVTDRIEAKLGRNRNATRAKWFGEALELVTEAKSLYSTGDYSTGVDKLRAAQELLEQGNKAHRRKASFRVGPGGDESSPFLVEIFHGSRFV